MKAWTVWDFFAEEPVLIFAEHPTLAKRKAMDELDSEYIDLRCHRERAFDDMENASKKELVEKQLSEGWQFDGPDGWVSSKNVDYVDEQGNPHPVKEGAAE